jgi:hypothetical protein
MIDRPRRREAAEEDMAETEEKTRFSDEGHRTNDRFVRLYMQRDWGVDQRQLRDIRRDPPRLKRDESYLFCWTHLQQATTVVLLSNRHKYWYQYGIMRTIVFDLDGTLVDTAPDLISTLNLVLVGEGLMRGE